MDFMRFRKLYFLISALVLVPGIASLILFGLNPSIDFTGGTLWEIRLESGVGSQPPSASLATGGESGVIGEVEAVFSAQGVEVASVQPSEENQFIIRAAELGQDQLTLIKTAMEKKIGKFEEVRYETLGPTLGRELLAKAGLAVLLAALVILGYVAYRFKDLMYGVTAILAMFHDSLVLLGVFSLLGHFCGVEVGTLFVTAVLTTLSFSVHDTIVVFDRIREILRHSHRLSLEAAADQAVGETLVRSLNNSLTIFFMLLAMILLGGESLRWFIFALLVGTVTGTYSSTFTATPLLIVWPTWVRFFSRLAVWEKR